MIHRLIQAALSPIGDQRQLRSRVDSCESRIALINQDLDCDIDGSLAEAIGDLRTDIEDLRSLVQELYVGTPTRAPR